MSDTRQHAHPLIDRMPETQLTGLVQFLETIVDPVATAFRHAPLDDEPETVEEKAAARSASTMGLGSSRWRKGASALESGMPCILGQIARMAAAGENVFSRVTVG